jgi:hypothetical protein
MSDKKLIGKIFLTKEQVSEAFSYLYDQYGASIQLWDDIRKTKEINLYWKDKL